MPSRVQSNGSRKKRQIKIDFFYLIQSKKNPIWERVWKICFFLSFDFNIYVIPNRIPNFLAFSDSILSCGISCRVNRVHFFLLKIRFLSEVLNHHINSFWHKNTSNSFCTHFRVHARYQAIAIVTLFKMNFFLSLLLCCCYYIVCLLCVRVCILSFNIC